MLHLLALAGVLGLSFSAVLVRLANVSPVTAAFYRAAYAVPLLAAIALVSRPDRRRTPRERMLAGASGILLAVDLGFWHQSIALIGVGLATVIVNVQVVFVTVLAWLLHGERPTRRTRLLMAGVLGGLALTSGLARPDASGTAPALGTMFGVLAGASYAGFLIVFRMSNRALAPAAGPLLDATLGVAAGALFIAPADSGFQLAPSLPAHAWLALLALVSQVGGWMLIASALPRLPAVETSVLLLVQPVLVLWWGATFFDERLSSLQWVGACLVVGGVAMVAGMARGSSVARVEAGPPPGAI